ncbi:glycoside hydrolase family 18 protein [Scandinavium sp. H11S7]|uniref:Glycoside hydrolase family 18 protein n=1 Tax=Scandinavium hiltneri TaxID=2926519 RepID=A0ABT2E482_9ENTR|nr:glycoside hydrolase family 18 protein [Scandinavium hiltneri]MCS2162678.1 glycoside hydrolase family 18 protein [Scandinavium hiltneri]
MKKLTLSVCIAAAFLAQSAMAATTNHAISYVTSWGLPDNSASILDTSKVDTYLLAFGKWNSDGSIETSDSIATIPAYDAWYLPGGYNVWTQLKLAHPEKKMMIAFGGQKYEEIWSQINTPEKRTIVAKGLADLLKTPYPVYKKGLAPSEMDGACLMTKWDGTCDMGTYQKAGTVYLDGVDFDFEKAARLSEKENSDLLALATELRGMIGKDKLMSLTTYHVGADPENCADNTVFDNCSFVEHDRSSHNGEVKSLLSASKGLFDFYNVMAYDAGSNFKYQTAMANYAAAVGDKTKIILGTTINAQWAPEGSFVETKENNLERARWQAAEGYGGYFAWALGSNTQSMSLTDQSAYLNEMKDVADAAVPADVEPEPEDEGEEQGPADSVISDTVVAAGEIIVVIPNDNFKTDDLTVKKNDVIVGTLNDGKYEKTMQSQAVKKTSSFMGQPVLSFYSDLKAGDVVSVIDTSSKKALSTVNVTAEMLAPIAPDAGTITNAATEFGKSTNVIFSSALKHFNSNNRTVVKLNGQVIAESYAGNLFANNATPRTLNKKSQQVEVEYDIPVSTMQDYDILTVDVMSGTPGQEGYVLRTLNKHYYLTK